MFNVTLVRMDEVKGIDLTEKFIDSAAAIFFDWTFCENNCPQLSFT